jgi:hypothetical protein
MIGGTQCINRSLTHHDHHQGSAPPTAHLPIRRATDGHGSKIKINGVKLHV